MNSIFDFNAISDFVIVGAMVGAGGYIGFNILTGSIPGLGGLILPAGAGAVLGAMLYIFNSGMAGG